MENTTLELECVAQDGNPTVGSFSWYKDNYTTIIGMLSNLSISKLYRTDAGVYRCEGSNNIGQNGIDTVYVNVLCKSFYKDMQDISLSLLQLYCNSLRWGRYKVNVSSKLPVFIGVRVARSFVFCVCFVDRYFSLCPFSFGHFVVCPS